MGCCAGGERDPEAERERAMNKEINRGMKGYKEENKRTLRVLLLGPGDSGKTTIIKQMKKIHKGDISEDERHGFIAPIREAIFDYIYKLSVQSVLLTKSGHETDVDKSLYDLRDEFITKVHTTLDPEVIEKILTLFNDPGIQATLELRSLFQLADNVPYFMSRIHDIAQEEYLPTFEDYIRFRMRTTGYSSEKFETNVGSGSYTFEFTDVGGQRSERRKWMKLVNENINGVLYIMAISEYDMLLFEDETVKRLDEAYTLFADVMKQGFFEDKSVVMFFNKYDLFEEKIKHVPITVAFPDFNGTDPHDPGEVTRFLFERFEAMYAEHFAMQERQGAQMPALHYHLTTALDTNLIESLLRDIQADIIRQKLHKAGYI